MRRFSTMMHVRRMSSKMAFTRGLDPRTLSAAKPATLQNLVAGEWRDTSALYPVIDPLNGEEFIQMPQTSVSELSPFVDSLAACPKSGLHNPYKAPERYVEWGAISGRAAGLLADPEVADHFALCIQRVMPKSYVEAMKEVTVTRDFLYNFSGDGVRFLGRGFSNPGNHMGQTTNGIRWPYGPVAIISPFNFPLEIPALQMMGALYMGNKVLIKNAEKTSMVLEQFVRLLQQCGLPADSLDMMHSSGSVMSELLRKAPVRLTQFTGGSVVSEMLCREFHGKVKVEDAGFDWKILGPDVGDVDYVAWQCDQDAYAATGQKCSAESMIFAHENWLKDDVKFLSKVEALAARRKLDDLTIGPVLTHTTADILAHTKRLASIPGAKVLWGGAELDKHTIPSRYGAVKPTAVWVPLAEMVKKEHFEACTTEIFGPFQVITSYTDADVPIVLDACERMTHHLTAGVVSNDIQFIQKILGNTVNGVSYVGRRGRTTGAPQNSFFGPAGDPRGAGIGTPEAIQNVWSCHREIVEDYGPVADDWKTPDAI